MIHGLSMNVLDLRKMAANAGGLSLMQLLCSTIEPADRYKLGCVQSDAQQAYTPHFAAM